MSAPWTDQELKYLSENYTTKTHRQLSHDLIKMFGIQRTERGVRRKLNEDGLKKRNPNYKPRETEDRQRITVSGNVTIHRIL